MAEQGNNNEHRASRSSQGAGGNSRPSGRSGGYRGRDGQRSGGYRKGGQHSGGYRKDGERSGGYRKDGEGSRGGYRKDGQRSGGYRKDGDNRNGSRGGFRKGGEGRGERRDFKRDGNRSFNRDDRGPKRNFDHDDRGPKRDFKRNNDRDFKRDAQGSGEGGNNNAREERAPKRDFRHYNTTKDPRRKFDREGGKDGEARGSFDKKGSRKFDRDDRGPRNDRNDRNADANKPQRRRKSRATPARLAALEVVRTVRERRAFAQDVIAQVIDQSPMSVEDRSFATLLALGTVSARGTLDEIIDRALDNPEDVFRETRDALQISTYEIFFLGKEAHAAVDQGVEMVKSFSPGPAARVANAVLHKIVRLRLEFPFGNPATDIDALARTQAFPTWLARKLMEEMGPQPAIDFMRASNEQAPLYVGINACKATDEQVKRAFERAEEVAEPVTLGDGEVPGCLRVPESRALLVPSLARLITQGKILVSDAAAQLVAASVLPEEKPASVLEVGAGRATKTILLQSGAVRKYGTQIEDYVTIDNHSYKTRLLRERAETYGVNVAEAFTGNAMDLDSIMPDRTFEFIFVDAPCSGLGTLRRHPEIRWRLTEEDIPKFVDTQVKLLKAAARHVAVGGSLAYSTCTVTREENAASIKAFLDSEEGKAFKLAPIGERTSVVTRLAPGSSDAHFAVRFVREA